MARAERGTAWVMAISPYQHPYALAYAPPSSQHVFYGHPSPSYPPPPRYDVASGVPPGLSPSPQYGYWPHPYGVSPQTAPPARQFDMATGTSHSSSAGGAARSLQSAGESKPTATKPTKPPPLVVVYDPNNLPSVGSKGHDKGTCDPCSFFRRNKCTSGKDCSHCHYPHEKQQRPGKRARERAARVAAAKKEAEALEDASGSEGADRSDTANTRQKKKKKISNAELLVHQAEPPLPPPPGVWVLPGDKALALAG